MVDAFVLTEAECCWQMGSNIRAHKQWEKKKRCQKLKGKEAFMSPPCDM